MPHGPARYQQKEWGNIFDVFVAFATAHKDVRFFKLEMPVCSDFF